MFPTLKKPNIAFFILLLAPYIKPALVENYHVLDLLYTAWKFCSLLYLTISLLPRYIAFHPKKNMLSLFCLCAFWLIYVINCAASNTDFLIVFTAAWASLLCTLLVAYEAQIGNGWILLRAVSVLSVFLILAHAVTVVLLPTSASTVFLFGMDNYSAFFIYPMLCLVLYYQSLRYGKLKWHSWALLLLSVFLFIYTASYTAAAAGLLFLLLMLFYPFWRKLPKIRGIRWMIPLFALILWLIIEYQIQNILAIVLDSMSKGVTLNSRTIIWDYVIELIKEKPIFGHGNFSSEQISDYILYGTSHAHNFLLELLMRTGIAGTTAFLVFQCNFVKNFRSARTERHQDYILIAGLISQLFLSFMDYYPTILIYYLFMAVLYYRNYFTPPVSQPRSQS